MKRLSYLLILFISLFIVTGIVNAYDNGGSLNLDPALYIDGEKDTLYIDEYNYWYWGYSTGQLLGSDVVKEFTNGSYEKICNYSISGSLGEVDLVQVVSHNKSIILDLRTVWLSDYSDTKNIGMANAKVLDLDYCPNSFIIGLDKDSLKGRIVYADSYSSYNINSFADGYYQVYVPARAKQLATGCSYKDTNTGNNFILFFDANGYVTGTFHNGSTTKAGFPRIDGHVEKAPENVYTSVYFEEIIHESFYFFHTTPGTCPEITICYDKKNKVSYITPHRNVTDDCKNVNYIESTAIDDPIEEPVERAAGCSSFNNSYDCTTNNDYSCVWVDKKSGKINTDAKDGYCNADNLQYIQCGGAFDIPAYLPRIISFVINFLKIVTPIILIFTSALTLLKAITASKEDEMNKAKATLIRRIAIAALIFFTITITEFVIDKVADDGEPAQISDCLDCFINNNCQSGKYYKNYIDKERYQCFYVEDKTAEFKGECH